MSNVIDPSRRARKEAQKAQAAQEKELAKQRQQEEARLAEEESEIARRKALGERGAGGRSLLIATSQTGTANSGGASTLGGQ